MARKRAGKGGGGSSGSQQQPGTAASSAGPAVDAGWHCFDNITQGGGGLAAIAALALLLHLNTLEGGFVYDDARGVVTNSDVPGDQPLANLFINDFWGKPMSRYQSHKSYRCAPRARARGRAGAALASFARLSSRQPGLSRTRPGVRLGQLYTWPIHPGLNPSVRGGAGWGLPAKISKLSFACLLAVLFNHPPRHPPCPAHHHSPPSPFC